MMQRIITLDGKAKLFNIEQANIQK